MANLPLAFAEAGIGAILLVAGISGDSLGDVLRGNVKLNPLVPGGGNAAAPAGSSTTAPSTSGVTSGPGGTAGDQKAFGQALSKISGLDPGFVDHWLLHEQPPGSPATPGSNNWLNVQYTDSGPNAEYWRIANMNPQDAAAATWAWLQQNQPGIAAAAGQGAAAQVQALEASGWASSHYGYQSPAAFLA